MHASSQATIQVLMVEDDDRLAALTERYLVKHELLVTASATATVRCSKPARIATT